MVRTALRSLDRRISKKIAQHSLGPHLQVILLHKLYRRSSDIRFEDGTTNEGFTTSHLETLIETLIQFGYRFIGPRDLNENLDRNLRYVMLTFDDGYASNLRLMPILEKHDVPVTVFISTNHVKEGKCFWWDVLSRELRRRQVSDSTIRARDESLAFRKWSEQEDELRKEFGENCFAPVGDEDRPMTEAELKELGRHHLIEIGNHTTNHLNLPIYDRGTIERDLVESNDYLEKVTGRRPIAISYPYGCFSPVVVDAAREAGFSVGITTVLGRVSLNRAMNLTHRLQLDRVQLSGYFDIRAQCERLFPGFSVFRSLIQRPRLQ